MDRRGSGRDRFPRCLGAQRTVERDIRAAGERATHPSYRPANRTLLHALALAVALPGGTAIFTTSAALAQDSCVLSGGLDRAGNVREPVNEARQGIAAAIAMSSAPMPCAPGRTSWAANVGYFQGAAAFGGSLTHRFHTANPFGLTLGYAYGGGSSHAARLGLMGEF